MNRAKAILTACFQPIVNTFKEKHFMKIHPIYPHLLGWLLYGTLSTLLTPNTGFAQTAYVRSDHVNAVIYQGGDMHINELSLPLNGSWHSADLTQMTGAPLTIAGISVSDAAEPSGYVRSDNVNAVVYRAQSEHIFEVSLPLGGSWSAGDLTALTGAPLAGSGPVGYRRSDNVNAVLFVGLNSHIYEMSLPLKGAWKVADLTGLTGAPLASGAPAAYVRSDNVNAVVYRASNGHIHEMSLPLNGSWSDGDLTQLTNAPVSGSAPFGYRRSDNVNSVVYVGSGSSHVYELYLAPNSPWRVGDLTSATGAPLAMTTPSAFVRSDQINSVQYVGLDNQIYELYLPMGSTTWQEGNLSGLTGAISAFPVGTIPTPAAYRRSDAVNSVVYCGYDDHIHELYLPYGAPAWHTGDLSGLTGGGVCVAQIPE
jgi:hypothetical protein